MSQAWITTSSTNVEAIVNPLNAACNAGFVPEDLYLLENPGVTETLEDGEVSLERAKALRDEGKALLADVTEDLDLGVGSVVERR